MANVESRPRANGGTNYRVRWVLGGGRRGEAPGALETFSRRADADAFKLMVEACGGQWPAGWVKGSGLDPKARPALSSNQSGDWRGAAGSHTTCQLCGLVMPSGQWGFDGGPLCRPDDLSRQNCYRLWVVHGERPAGQRPGARPLTQRPLTHRPARQPPEGRSTGSTQA
ncbi:MAG: hypothetical protein QOG22_2558 [Pseudonocardiales bacterium]|nr:hypothetical protein [Pseudonocardiales bacterium]